MATPPSKPSHVRRVFVSHSTRDLEHVVELLQLEEGDGYRAEYFIAKESINHGEEWRQELYGQLEHCEVFVLFWSRAASESEWVAEELDLALKRRERGEDIRILPRTIDDTPLPTGLEAYQATAGDVAELRPRLAVLESVGARALATAVAYVVPAVATVAYWPSERLLALAWASVFSINAIHMVWLLHHVAHVPIATAASLTTESPAVLLNRMRRLVWDRAMARHVKVRYTSHPLGGEVAAVLYWSWPLLAVAILRDQITWTRDLVLIVPIVSAFFPFAIAYVTNLPINGNLFPMAFSMCIGVALVLVLGAATTPDDVIVQQVTDTSFAERGLAIIGLAGILLGSLFVPGLREKTSQERLDAEARWFAGSVIMFGVTLSMLAVLYLPYT